MSQEKTATSRALEQVVVRAPRLTHLALAQLRRLPPGSQARRRSLSLLVKNSTEAINRGELAAVVPIVFEPDVDVRAIGMEKATGFDERYEGHEGLLRSYGDWTAVMGPPNWKLEKVIDLGDRVLLRVRLAGRGRTSGVTLARTGGVLMSFSERGMICRWEVFWHWDEALEAAGLSE